MSKKADYNNPEFINEMKKCKAFFIKDPKGGHYNDGFELLCVLKRTNKQNYLNLLDELNVNYTLYTQKPEQWTPPPFEDEGEKFWIAYKPKLECFGFSSHIQLNPSEYSIQFNLNQNSYYDVFLDDVKSALAFEQELLTRGLLK